MIIALALWLGLCVGAVVGYWSRGWADGLKRAHLEDDL